MSVQHLQAMQEKSLHSYMTWLWIVCTLCARRRRPKLSSRRQMLQTETICAYILSIKRLVDSRAEMDADGVVYLSDVSDDAASSGPSGSDFVPSEEEEEIIKPARGPKRGAGSAGAKRAATAPAAAPKPKRKQPAVKLGDLLKSASKVGSAGFHSCFRPLLHGHASHCCNCGRLRPLWPAALSSQFSARLCSTSLCRYCST
jgi:hypothetical protein